MMPEEPSQSVARGGLYMTLGMLAVALMGAVVKWASAGFSTELLTSLRFIFGLVIAVAIFAVGRRVSLKSDSLNIQILIGLSWVLLVGIYYLSIRFIPLMDATLLLNTAAIFAPIFARVIDGKREPRLVWIGIVIGFLGVTVVLRPGPQLFENPISLIGILAGIFAGFRVFLLSKVKHEPSQRTTIYSLAVGSIFCLLVMAAVGFPIQVPQWEVMLFTPRQIFVPFFVDSSLVLAVIVLGGFSVLVNMFMAKSLRFATVGQISPFRYTAVAFAGFLDWSIWGVEPTWPSYVGFSLVLVGVMVIIRGSRV
jgi:drug/metabolite transporter (DMT)-like permease